MIHSKQLSGLRYVISYIFILHNLTHSSSLRRRIGELVPLVDIILVIQMYNIQFFFSL